MDTVRALIIAAVAFNGVLSGASLDQSIKQLPARRRMGVIAFSAYSRAADLGNGIVWYAILGVGAALLTIAAAVDAYLRWLHDGGDSALSGRAVVAAALVHDDTGSANTLSPAPNGG